MAKEVAIRLPATARVVVGADIAILAAKLILVALATTP